MPVKYPTVSTQITGTVNPSHAGARDATSGTVGTGGSGGVPTSFPTAIKYSKVAGGRGNQISINRYFIEFDTSDISVTPADAELSLYGFTNGGADFFAVKATFSDGTIANGDFDAIDGWSAGVDNSSNVTKYSDEVETFSTSGFNDIALTSAALSDMVSEDRFKICLIQAENDLANVAGGGVIHKTGFWRTTNTIHLDYTEGTAGFGHKTIGVASANIGKISGVATANIGKVIGVD